MKAAACSKELLTVKFQSYNKIQCYHVLSRLHIFLDDIAIYQNYLPFKFAIVYLSLMMPKAHKYSDKNLFSDLSDIWICLFETAIY